MKHLAIAGSLILLLASCGNNGEFNGMETPDYVEEFDTFENEAFTAKVKVEPEVFDEEVFVGSSKAMKKTYMMESNDSSAQFIVRYYPSDNGPSYLDDFSCREELGEGLLVNRFMSLPYTIMYDYDTDIRYAESVLTEWTYYVLKRTPFISADEYYFLVYGVQNEGDSCDHVAEAAYFFDHVELKESIDEIE